MRRFAVLALLALVATHAAGFGLDALDPESIFSATPADSDGPDPSQYNPDETRFDLDEVFGGSTLIQWLPDARRGFSIDNSTECVQCTKKAAKHVLGHVIAHLKKVCDETKCPRIKEHCDWMAKHPKYALGTLIYHVRPHSLGFAYCIGDGECQHSDRDAVLGQLPETSQPLSVELFQELVERNETVSDALTDELTDEEAELIEARIEEQVPEDPSVQFPTDKSCRACIHLVGALVMKHHVDNFVKLCKSTSDPVVKAHCKWAKENFSMWLGMSAAAIRPKEYGCGFCFGKGACPSQYRHRHNRDDLIKQ